MSAPRDERYGLEGGTSAAFVGDVPLLDYSFQQGDLLEIFSKVNQTLNDTKYFNAFTEKYSFLSPSTVNSRTLRLHEGFFSQYAGFKRFGNPR